jgi:hypothetical protein
VAALAFHHHQRKATENPADEYGGRHIQKKAGWGAGPLLRRSVEGVTFNNRTIGDALKT